MTQQGLPFDGVLIGDAAAVAPYSATEWAHSWKLQHDAGTSFPNYGVFGGSGDGTHRPLEVDATAIVSTQVQVQTGAALVDGHFYENTAVVSFTIGANTSGNPRVDTVVLRLDYVAQTIRLAVKQGTPAGSPVAPVMQQDTVVWEIPVADIAVANGFATLAQSTITQRQRFVGTQGAGWQVYGLPIRYGFGAGINNLLTMSPAQTLLVPFSLVGNMLFQDVIIRVIDATGNPYQWGWDLYIEDTDDGNTFENTIRRVAQSDGDATGNLPATTSQLPPLATKGGIIPLPAGVYWLALQNRHGTNNFSFDSQVGNGFDAVFNRDIRRKATTNPNGQTLDAVTGWVNGFNIPCVIMRGRVTGQTVVPT